MSRRLAALTAAIATLAVPTAASAMPASPDYGGGSVVVADVRPAGDSEAAVSAAEWALIGTGQIALLAAAGLVGANTARRRAQAGVSSAAPRVA